MFRSESTRAAAGLASIVLLAGCASARSGGGGGQGSLGPEATATLRTAEGRVIGQVDLRDTPQDAVLLRVTLYGGVIPPGTHAFHIHETGRCEPDFGAAGDHFAPDGREHGVLNPRGRHRGDLPNVYLDNTGRTEFESLVQGLTTRPGAPGSLFDDDGSAFVLHAGSDDYRSQPSGDAGEAVACGVIRER